MFISGAIILVVDQGQGAMDVHLSSDWRFLLGLQSRVSKNADATSLISKKLCVVIFHATFTCNKTDAQHLMAKFLNTY